MKKKVIKENSVKDNLFLILGIILGVVVVFLMSQGIEKTVKFFSP